MAHKTSLGGGARRPFCLVVLTICAAFIGAASWRMNRVKMGQGQGMHEIIPGTKWAKNNSLEQHSGSMEKLPDDFLRLCSSSSRMSSPSRGRWPVKDGRKIPNVLIAGVQKGGTTAVYHHLKTYYPTQVCHATSPLGDHKHEKEVHFYDNHWEQGTPFYEALFADCSDDQLIVDATPEYALRPERIYELYEDRPLKVIVSVREPVSREISWYHHKARHVLTRGVDELLSYDLDILSDKGTMLSFPEYASSMKWLEKGSLHDMSMHGPNLKKWFELFDRSNILILNYDELKADSESYIRRVTDFLELEPLQDKKVAVSNAAGAAVVGNSHPSSPEDCKLQEKLFELTQESNNLLYRMLDQCPGPSMEQRPYPKFTFQCIDTR